LRRRRPAPWCRGALGSRPEPPRCLGFRRRRPGDELFGADMNVLMVTHTYPKFPGDVTAPFVESIANALARRGHEVDVLVPFNPELQPRQANGVVVSPFRYAPARASTWGYGGALEGGRRVRPSMYALAPAVTVALRRAVKK